VALTPGIRDRLTSLFKRSGQKVDDLTSEERQEFIRAAADMGGERISKYGLFEDYYEGEHRVRLLERAKKYLEASGLPYTENFCETIVDVLAQRLEVVGFKVEEHDDASDWLTKTVWPKNGMDEKQGVVHTQTSVKGDGFVIVTFDPVSELPKFTWNRPEIVKPVYADDDPDEMLYACKVWTTAVESPTNPNGEVINRLNIYFPDRVEKWFSVGSKDAGKETWVPHLDEEDVVDGIATWPVPWTTTGTSGGEPIGIPVVHFRNKPKGRTFGRSEIRGTIPQQEALTKQLVDLFYVMDAQGWQQRWATGVDDKASLNVAIGEFLKASNDNAKFGQFTAEDPGPMGEQIEGTLRRIAARAQTPLHLLMTGGTLPSGESLKAAEAPLVHKADDRKKTHGGSWSKVMGLGVAVMQVFGTLPFELDDEAEIETVWADSESRNEQAETNTLGVQVELLGLSKTTALRKLGYDPEGEQANREKEKEAEPDPPLPPEFAKFPEPVVNDPAVPPPSPPVREK
jgi:hypothetical protein